MINTVVITGRMVKDLDLRYTNNAKAVGSGTLAVDRQFKNAQGEKETDFLNFVIWGKSAEALANFTKKGSLIGITGRLQVRTYENNEGRKVWVTEVVAENFTFLESKNSQNNSNTGGSNYSQVNSQSNNQSRSQGNFKSHKQEEDPFLTHGQTIDIEDSMLPF
ncbi:MAG TPA: single-stranded DNA-binding protein [Aliicoccus persicus]|uniref:Single-stranded DNA-binding protein n=1 Tax=Aliicoccus persicus TaxID=930138 RepID=A0A921JB63_9STAP|nr:single-stranded DNA-binding protein [Aliicoccus persicus]